MKYDHQPQPDIEPDELFPCKDERCEEPVRWSSHRKRWIHEHITAFERTMSMFAIWMLMGPALAEMIAHQDELTQIGNAISGSLLAAQGEEPDDDPQ